MLQPKIRRLLGDIVGTDNLLWRRSELIPYKYDASLMTGEPDAVVFPSSTEEVSKIVYLCVDEKIHFAPRGSGTNLSGGSVLVQGGIIIELSRMNRILEVNIPDEYAVVESGVFNLDLQEELAKHGYEYAPDPASQKVATMGGTIAENSGGPHGVKCGVTTNHVLGMRVVLANSDVIDCGGPTESAPSYDIRGVLIGSEGTLGIVTEVTVRIRRKPEAVKTMLVVYDTIESAGASVSAVVAAGIIPATLEMMDRPIIHCVEESYQCGYPLDAEAVLIIELDGLRDDLDEQARRVEEICRENGARDVRIAADDAERDRLWAGRRGAFGAVARICLNYLVMDGTVPRTKLPEVLRKVGEVAEKYKLKAGNVFHAGDGNLHPLFFITEGTEDELCRVHAAGAEILKTCLAVGGTISGEHGIGVEKIDAMRLQFSEEDLQMMRSVKKAFDPYLMCNPGKVLPEPR